MYKMIRYVNLPFYEDGYKWWIDPRTGSLYYKDTVKKATAAPVPPKVEKALSFCYNPYLCRPYDTLSEYGPAVNKIISSRLLKIHRRLVAFGNRRFLLSRLYASIITPIFPTTAQAMRAISDIPLQKEEDSRRCLQRTLLAAKTSESFKENGVLFIGALLPTSNMHAWILEDGTQPDIADRDWMLYRPLLAFYYS